MKIYKSKKRNKKKRKENSLERIFKDWKHFYLTNDKMAKRYYKNKYLLIRILTYGNDYKDSNYEDHYNYSNWLKDTKSL